MKLGAVTSGSILGNWRIGSILGSEAATDMIYCPVNSTTTIYTLPAPVIAVGEEVSMAVAIIADGYTNVGLGHWERRIVVKNIANTIQTADGTTSDTDVTAFNTSNISSSLSGCSAKIAVVGGTLVVQMTTPIGIDVKVRATVSWERNPGNTNASTPTWTMPGALHMWRGDSATLSGSNVTGITDTVGSANQVSSATNPTKTTLGANARTAWTFITNSYLKTAGGLAENMTAGSIAWVVQLASTASQAAAVCGAETGAPTTYELAAYYDTATTTRIQINHAGTVGVSGGAGGFTSLHDVLFTWDGSHQEVYINGSLANNNVIVGGPDTTNDAWLLGVIADLTSLPGSADGMVMGEARIGNQRLTATDATNFHNYRTAYYA